jgi:phenylacetate-CoA ligase
MPDWVKLYHRLPYPIRVLAVSARGYYLRWWRYGPETDHLVEEALERETWSPDRWKAWQEERLAYVLHRAATRVPYYRDQWQERRRRGDRASWEVLENWPILKKEPLRANPRAFVADDCDIRRMFHEHTSGTTGTPLSLWVSREALRKWYALFEARWRRWYGISRHDRWAILGGQLVVPFGQTKPPFWVWNIALRQLYLSSYHLSPEFIPAYIEALRQYRVHYLWGYASSLYTLAAIALEQGLEIPSMHVAVSNAEPLFPYQREAIAQAFRCPVRDTYGMTEMVAGASECEYGRMHLWPEAGVVEVMADEADEPLPPGQVGRLICTGLINADMPLIRYELGDRGALAPVGEHCACGRTLPILSSVEGRLDDVVFTPDGRRIGRLDPTFKADMPIREAQIIQESLHRVRVRFVPAPGSPPDLGEEIVRRLRERLGEEMEIVAEEVDHIPRGPNGKFRAVISYVLPEEVGIAGKRTLG